MLAKRRKACRVCVDRNPGEIYNGSEFEFDPPVVSYWSQWLGHPRPELLIVGQDFGDVGYFQRYRGHDEPNNETNDNLRCLLAEAGYKVAAAPGPDDQSMIFLTNSILCLKAGVMNTKIRDPWVKACAKLHLIPLLQSLQPRFIVGMGKGWMAVREALGLKESPLMIGQAAGKTWKHCEFDVFAMGHCSGLGLANRSLHQQTLDWRAMGASIAKIKQKAE